MEKYSEYIFRFKYRVNIYYYLLCKVLTKISVKKILKTFSAFMLFIQLLQLTIDYSEYHTVIDMKVGEIKLSITPLSL